MNFKTKAIGLLAGSALALSLATGAMAEDLNTTATLADGEACAVSAFGSTFDFGTYQYTGSGYNAPSTIPTFSVTVTNTEFAAPNCTVTVTPSGLTSATTTTDIADTTVALTFSSGGTVDGSNYTVTPGTPLVLNGALTTSALTLIEPASDYVGTIEVTAVNAG